MSFHFHTFLYRSLLINLVPVFTHKSCTICTAILSWFGCVAKLAKELWTIQTEHFLMLHFHSERTPGAHWVVWYPHKLHGFNQKVLMQPLCGNCQIGLFRPFLQKSLGMCAIKCYFTTQFQRCQIAPKTFSRRKGYIEPSKL